MRIEGDSYVLLRQLLEEVEKLATPNFLNQAQVRVNAMRNQHIERTQASEQAASNMGPVGEINPDYLCAVLGKLIQPTDIVINEAVRNVMSVFNQIPRTEGGTLVGMPAGGLSFSGGAALGMKLAHPERTVIHIVGDGTFYFSNPSSVYAVARQYGAPIFTVVLDNTGWSAVKQATLRMYPDGDACEQDEFSSILAPETNMAKLAEAAGAYGELLVDPKETEAAINRCLAAVREGRAAVLHARISKL